MKKLKILFLLLVTTFSIEICNASTNTFERTENNNYGVNKNFIIDENLNDILNTPLVNASEKIYDFGEILTDTEEQALYNQAIEFYNQTGMELIYLTANFDNTTDWENEEYATNFYDYNDFGLDLEYNSGVIVFRNSNSNPYYGIYTFGEAILYYSDERINYTLDDIHEHITTQKYYTAFSLAGNKLLNYYEDGIPYNNENAYIDEDGRIYREYMDENGRIYYEYIDEDGNVTYEYVDDSSSNWVPSILGGLFLSIIITCVTMAALLSKHKMIKREALAHNYLDRNSIVYTHRRNDFITSRTTSIARNTGTHGSGGRIGGSGSFGSTISRGSSGGFHGGGGRRG